MIDKVRIKVFLVNDIIRIESFKRNISEAKIVASDIILQPKVKNVELLYEDEQSLLTEVTER